MIEEKRTVCKKKTQNGDQRIKIDLLIHDLKVPLAVIEAGVVSLLNRQEKYGQLTDKQLRVLTRVLRNTKTTQTLVSDALELGRSREGIINLSRITLSEVIEQTLVEIFDLTHAGTAEKIRCCTDLIQTKAALEHKGVILKVDEGAWCQEVFLDEAKMKQILRNLLNNALKYRKSRVELCVENKGDNLVICVSDDGEGIPPTYHADIFKSYFQMDTTGSCPVRGHGLGLAGVMVLVEDLGGKLSLASDTGKGAQFVVEIPLNSKA